MMENIKAIIDMFFGKNPKKRFKRLIILTVVIAIVIMLVQNLSYNKKEGLSWKPAATINVSK